MELNKEDGGNRQYIVVQMPENSEKEPDKNICRDITRERIVRAIDMYGYESGFEYVRVGQALDAETLLEGELPPFETFAKYVYYLAIGEHIQDDQKINQESYFVGTKNNQDIYLIYNDNMESLQSLALSYEKAESFRAKSGEKKVIVYAPACFLDDEDLQEMKMEFVSIPYNLFSKNQEV
jgi:adenine-specific DNA-methyltransferase